MSNIALGLDVGERRIGVARGDLAVRIASPMPAIMNDEDVFGNLTDLIHKNDAQIVVVGLPRDVNGNETSQSDYSREFAHKLADFSGVKVVFQDESLTSVEAEKDLRSRRNFNEKMMRDGTLDSEAAALILQDFLEGGENVVL